MSKNQVVMSETLKKLRKSKKMPLSTVAEATGMSYPYPIGPWRIISILISIVNLQKLAEFFNVELVYFFSKPDKS